MTPERLSFLGLATKRKKPNKPNFGQPVLDQWVTTGFEYDWVAGSATSPRSPQREMRGPRPKSKPGLEEEQPGNNELSRQRRTEQRTMGGRKTTKQSQFPITTIKYSDLQCCGEAPKGLAASLATWPGSLWRGSGRAMVTLPLRSIVSSHARSAAVWIKSAAWH